MSEAELENGESEKNQKLKKASAEFNWILEAVWLCMAHVHDRPESFQAF